MARSLTTPQQLAAVKYTGALTPPTDVARSVPQRSTREHWRWYRDPGSELLSDNKHRLTAPPVVCRHALCLSETQLQPQQLHMSDTDTQIATDTDTTEVPS